MHFGFMNIVSLYKYRRWSLCNECCIHEIKVYFLVLFIIVLHSSLCLFPAYTNVPLQC